MNAKQFMAFFEQVTRGITVGGETMFFLPINGNIRPNFEATDETRKEARGTNQALGDDIATLQRMKTQVSSSLNIFDYPGAELGHILKHIMGGASARTVAETTAYLGTIFPVVNPYGNAGANLGLSALAMIPNTDEEGTTKSQEFGGLRYNSYTFTVTPEQSVLFAVEGMAPGDFVGDPDQPETAGIVLPSTPHPFLYSSVKFYIGQGNQAVRTGAFPDLTDIQPGAMVEFCPEDFTYTYTTGREDSTRLCGVGGANQTTQSGQLDINGSFTMDYRDPDAGFSSADEFKKIYAGPNSNSLLVVQEMALLAGDTTLKYRRVHDFPAIVVTPDNVETSVEGQNPKAKFNFSHKNNPTYPFAMFTVDQADSYGI